MSWQEYFVRIGINISWFGGATFILHKIAIKILIVISMQGVIYLIIHVKSAKNSMLVACPTNFYNHKNLLNRFGKGQRVSISLMFKVRLVST